jgi:hypothetical protein
MKKTILTLQLVVILALSAFTGTLAVQAKGTESEVTTSNVQAASVSAGSSVAYSNTVSEELQLLLGSIKLKGTSNAITKKQAVKLLPLWNQLSVLNQSTSTQINLTQGQGTTNNQPQTQATPTAPATPTPQATLPNQGMLPGQGYSPQGQGNPLPQTQATPTLVTTLTVPSGLPAQGNNPQGQGTIPNQVNNSQGQVTPNKGNTTLNQNQTYLQYQNTDAKNQAQVNSLVSQIKAIMTSAQLEAIANMNINQTMAPTMMNNLGVSMTGYQQGNQTAQGNSYNGSGQTYNTGANYLQYSSAIPTQLFDVLIQILKTKAGV